MEAVRVQSLAKESYLEEAISAGERRAPAQNMSRVPDRPTGGLLFQYVYSPPTDRLYKRIADDFAGDAKTGNLATTELTDRYGKPRPKSVHTVW